MNRSLQSLEITLKALRDKISAHQKDDRFRAIEAELKSIQTTLQEGKPTLHVVSSNPDRIVSTVAALKTSEFISSHCRVIATPLPQMTKLDKSLLLPRLRVQTSEYEETSPLEVDKQYQIGRAASCDFLIPDRCLAVSGYHSMIAYDLDSLTWSIQDTSRNGTFVNGERLAPNQWQLLKTGDRIGLGNCRLTPQSPLLTFDNAFERIASFNFASEWRDFDYVCFVPDYGNVLTDVEKRSLETFNLLISKSYISILIDVRSSDCPSDDTTARDIESFQKALRADVGSSTLKAIPIFSSVLNSQSEQTPDQEAEQSRASLNLNRDFTFFLNRLEKKLEGQRSRFLSSRLQPQIDSYQRIIETLLENKKEIDSSDFNPSDPSTNPAEEKQRKINVENALQIITDQKQATFDQLDSRVAFAEKQLFDSFYADSFPCSLQKFSQALELHVNKVKNRATLQLKYSLPARHAAVKTASIQKAAERRAETRVIAANTAMFQFCKDELHQWAVNLWLDIHSNPRDASLDNLYREIFDVLATIPDLDITHIQERLSRQDLMVDVESILESTFTQAPDKVVIKEPSAISYLLKKFRGQWMQFIFLFSFFSILGIAGRRQIMRNIMAPVVSLFHKAPLMTGLMLIGLVFWGVNACINIHRTELNESRDKQANDLRSKLNKHYLELAKKHLAAPFLLALKSQLAEEKARIETIQLFIKPHSQSEVSETVRSR